MGKAFHAALKRLTYLRLFIGASSFDWSCRRNLLQASSISLVVAFRVGSFSSYAAASSAFTTFQDRASYFITGLNAATQASNLPLTLTGLVFTQDAQIRSPVSPPPPPDAAVAAASTPTGASAQSASHKFPGESSPCCRSPLQIESLQDPPAVNQVELSPFLQRRELVSYCQQQGIALEVSLCPSLPLLLPLGH